MLFYYPRKERKEKGREIRNGKKRGEKDCRQVGGKDLKSGKFLRKKDEIHGDDSTSFIAAAAKSLQSCPTLCDPIDGSPPGSPVPGILQARTQAGCHFLLQCMKVKSEGEVTQVVSDPQRPHGLQPTRLLHPWDFPGRSTGVGCHYCVFILLTKVRLVKAMVFPVVMYGCESWMIKLSAEELMLLNCDVGEDS